MSEKCRTLFRIYLVNIFRGESNTHTILVDEAETGKKTKNSIQNESSMKKSRIIK